MAGVARKMPAFLPIDGLVITNCYLLKHLKSESLTRNSRVVGGACDRSWLKVARCRQK
jgi:hypothetical protein